VTKRSKLKMFPIRPNPDYVPGGVNNFWLSGNGGPPAEGGAGGHGGGGGGVDKGNMVENHGGSEVQGVKSAFSVIQKMEMGQPRKEQFLTKFGNMMENFASLVNTYNI